MVFDEVEDGKRKKGGKLTSIDGETKIYQIIVEDPQAKSLKVTDFVRLGEEEYITGVTNYKDNQAN